MAVKFSFAVHSCRARLWRKRKWFTQDASVPVRHNFHFALFTAKFLDE